MPFLFDAPQQQQITTLFQAAEANPAVFGAFSPMYSYINGLLITGSPPPNSDPAITAVPGLEARQALEGLSNFVVSGASSPAPSPELANLSAAYLDDRALDDRAAVLDARNRFDAEGLVYGVDT